MPFMINRKFSVKQIEFILRSTLQHNSSIPKHGVPVSRPQTDVKLVCEQLLGDFSSHLSELTPSSELFLLADSSLNVTW